MMNTNNDDSTVHFLPISDRKHPKSFPYERPNCRLPAYLKPLSDVATLITDVVFRKSPIYRFSGRMPLRAILREIGLALRAKRLPRSDHPYSTLATTRKVLGSTERGRRPSIFFMGVRYTSLRLARTPSLIGRKVILIVNKNNLQTISVFLENGQFFDALEPSSAIWRVPHSYEFRKQFLKRCRQAYGLKQVVLFYRPAMLPDKNKRRRHEDT